MTEIMDMKSEEYKNLMERMLKYRKQTQKASLKYYKKKYTITEDMSDEEKEAIQKNIDERRARERARYEANKEYHRLKSKRYRERVKAKKLAEKEQNA